MATPVEDKIESFFNCALCLTDLPPNTSPSEYARINVGWTEKGLQVWCVRHDKNVVSLDFLGQKISYATE